MRRNIIIIVTVLALLSPVMAISCNTAPETEAEAVIGPEGGVVNVTDPESSLAGARIDIPEGTVTEDTIFTISKVADPPDLPNPEDIAEAGPTANVEATNELVGFVAVTIPCPAVTNITQIMKAYHYNEGTSEWEETPIVFSNAETGTVTILTDHLSWYRAAIEWLYVNPASFTVPDFYMGSDRTSFDNWYYAGSQDPAACTLGMCHGMSSLVKYWYENKDTDLRCAYSPEAGAPLACNLQLMHEHIWSTPLLAAERLTTGIFDATAIWQSCLTSLQKGDIPLIAVSEGLLGARHCVAAYKWEQSTQGDILGYLYIYDPNEPEDGDLKITCKAATTAWLIPVVKMEYSNYGYDFKYFANSFIYKSKSVVEDLISDFPPDNWCYWEGPCEDWVLQIVDSTGNLGMDTSLAFGPGPAIGYFDMADHDIKFAYDRNDDGDFEDAGEMTTVDSPCWAGAYLSVAFGTGPAISYYDLVYRDMKLAYDRNDDGDFEDAGEIIEVDSEGDIGGINSLAFRGGPAVSYRDSTNDDLKLAYDRNNDGDFEDPDEISVVDNTGGGWPSLAFGAGPAMSYQHDIGIKFAYDRNDDGDFLDAGEVITVESTVSCTWTNSLAFDSIGRPAISYWDGTNGILKLAYDRNNDGDFEDDDEITIVDSEGYVGRWNSLAFSTGPAIAYYDDTNSALKFAHDWNDDGDFEDAGEIITVDDNIGGGTEACYCSLVFGPEPAISYWDTFDGIMLARCS